MVSEHEKIVLSKRGTKNVFLLGVLVLVLLAGAVWLWRG